MRQEKLAFSMYEIKAFLRQQAAVEGFSVAAVAPPAPPPHADSLGAWLQEGRHGEMGWMTRQPERRTDPRQLLEGLGSLLVLGLNDRPAGDPLAPGRDGGRAWVAAHARHREYHEILKERLQRLAAGLERWLGQPVVGRLCVDTAPLLEKPLAAAAGLGWQGKNSLLVSPRFGCWLLLAEFLLPFSLPADPPMPDRCGRCRRCLDACPTDALAQPYRLDARRCLAYLTIEHAGPIPMRYREAMGNRVYGCDSCLLACPWNRFAPVNPDPDLRPHPLLEALRLLDCLDLEEATFRTRLAHTPLRRMGIVRFLRNVAVALGNGGTPEGLAGLARLLHHGAPLVRGHAAWGIGRLSRLQPGEPFGSTPGILLEERAGLESDPWVREEIEQARQDLAKGFSPVSGVGCS
ncbi:MAG: tRNA epoxyqueuosine(34) reductase QueG [Magnetococcus sp. XQGC-1]